MSCDDSACQDTSHKIRVCNSFIQGSSSHLVTDGLCQLFSLLLDVVNKP